MPTEVPLTSSGVTKAPVAVCVETCAGYVKYSAAPPLAADRW